MPPALDTVSASGTAIGATIAALAAVTGDSLQVKNTNGNSAAWLLNFWADVQLAGSVRIRSPKLHDNVDGIRSRTRVNCLEPLMPWGAPQKLYAQDVLTVELGGSTTGGDIETVPMLIYYEDLLGQSLRGQTFDQIRARIEHILPVRLAITVGSTAAYTGARAINADTDYLQANRDYALLGATSDLRVSAICVKGPDTGNLRVSVPGGADVQGAMKRGARFFRDLSTAYGLPVVPIINAANKGATLVDVLGDENGGTANVTLWLALLSK